MQRSMGRRPLRVSMLNYRAQRPARAGAMRRVPDGRRSLQGHGPSQQGQRSGAFAAWRTEGSGEESKPYKVLSQEDKEKE